MKKYLFLLLMSAALSSSAQIKTLVVGQNAPFFTLRNVDNKLVSFNSYPKAKGFIIVFTCNTCPVAKAYEQRIIELGKKMAPLGYPVLAVNPNDADVSSGDSFAKMQARAKDKKYPFPYLYDAGQRVTNMYGATKTPQLFIAQKTKKGLIIQYTGAIDDDQELENPGRTKYVERAIAALNANKLPAIKATKAIGCSVKRAD